MRWTVLAVMAAWNAVVFLLYGEDKRRAVKNGRSGRRGREDSGKRRIPERTLLGGAFLCGGAGAFLGMAAFRHKTRHWSFRLGVPAALVLTIAAVLAVWRFLP